MNLLEKICAGFILSSLIVALIGLLCGLLYVGLKESPIGTIYTVLFVSAVLYLTRNAQDMPK
jgi:uncharacterized membrane protein